MSDSNVSIKTVEGYCIELSLLLDKYKDIFESIPTQEIEKMNELNDLEHQRQAEAFKIGYQKENVICAVSPSRQLTKMTLACIGFYDNVSSRRKISLRFTKNSVMEI